jgi:Fe-S oxidoreductase
MFGPRLARAFEAVKDRFDPAGILNPGKIVRAPKMNDRTLFRYPPDYAFADIDTGFDWSAWPGKAGGLQGAVEMCNNNGACRKLAGGVMCPSYRVTRNERDVTRGRANTLRLALSGRIGPDALFSDEMDETLKLCVSCKACRRECPTGVDMAKMKTEVLHQRAKKKGVPLGRRLIAELPRYAPYAARLRSLMALRDRVPALAALSEKLLGFSRRRSLPGFAPKPFRDEEARVEGREGSREIILFADTFGRWMEPGTLRAALKVLRAGGYSVVPARAADGGRPLCCGRTYLAAGMIEKAREEARRTLEALTPHVARGAVVVGLEPSCILTLRDEFVSLLPGEESRALAESALLAEEFVAREADAGSLALDLHAPAGKALLHGHCHQKAFGTMSAVERALRLVPGMAVETVDSSCCGMAGAFGYDAETIDISLAMGELSLLPAVRAAKRDTLVVADGTSCRHQIADGTGRKAQHVMEILALALDERAPGKEAKA